MMFLHQLSQLDRPEAVCLGLAAAAFALWCHYLIAVWRESLRSRKEISRYPMFAARDRLVRLVIDGEMSEGDPAWRATYASVTELLKMHQRLRLINVVSNFARHIVEVLTNPAVRERTERLNLQLKRAKKASPAFAETSIQIESAFSHMVWMRTGVFPHAQMRLFLLWFRIKLAIRPIHVAVAVVEHRRTERRRVKRIYAGGVSRALRPNSSDIAGFSAACA
jgi:hypothetical protein